MYTANQIADFFLSKVNPEVGDTISPLKLQKLVYYAQVWHYTIFDEVLFEEKIEAWTHGPVVRSLYSRFSNYGKNESITVFDLDIPDFPEKTLDLLNEVQEVYGEHSGSYLEKLSHSESPWQMAREGHEIWEKCENEITLSSIKDFYSKLRDEKK